jgi:CRP-like cAMP-binding protein
MRKVLHILGYFSDEDIAWMTEVGRKLTINSNDYLIKTEVELSSIFFVLNGAFQVESNDGVVVAKVKKGEILGEMSFIEEEMPVANVRALETSDVIALDHDFMNDRFISDRGFEARFYKAISLFLSSRLRSTSGRLANENSEGKEFKSMQQDIDNSTLNHIQVAGERFNRLVEYFSS